jgi:pyridoxine 5-phosphate synthase
VRTRLNLEMAVAPQIVDFALELRPEMATLVPERRQEVTTEGGLDASGQLAVVKKTVTRLQKSGILVSLFIDPDKAQVEAAAASGAAFVEFHTGSYADAVGEAATEKERGKLFAAAALAKKKGLRVNAGHGLTYWNVQALTGLPGIEEFNIGHSIISRAVLVGLERAVADMKDAIREGECHFT